MMTICLLFVTHVPAAYVCLCQHYLTVARPCIALLYTLLGGVCAPVKECCKITPLEYYSVAMKNLIFHKGPYLLEIQYDLSKL